MRDLLGTSGEEGFGYARKVDVMTFMKSKNYEDNLRRPHNLSAHGLSIVARLTKNIA